MFGIVNLLLNIIGEMRSMYDLKFMEETNAAEVLLGCQSLQELKTCMSDIFIQMRDYIQQKEKDLSGSRIRAIMDFIKTNYNRPDMSITYLSQVFNKNESYISRSFKRHVGMGFLDYLHSLRIIEAKRLIKAGNNIKEVSVLTGYTNETTLIRAFKRYEGITPGKLKATESHLG
jgi:YesN/AraC family two-component response regulator